MKTDKLERVKSIARKLFKKGYLDSVGDLRGASEKLKSFNNKDLDLFEKVVEVAKDKK